jgi:hypothetical protein
MKNTQITKYLCSLVLFFTAFTFATVSYAGNIVSKSESYKIAGITESFQSLNEDQQGIVRATITVFISALDKADDQNEDTESSLHDEMIENNETMNSTIESFSNLTYIQQREIENYFDILTDALFGDDTDSESIWDILLEQESSLLELMSSLQSEMIETMRETLSAIGGGTEEADDSEESESSSSVPNKTDEEHSKKDFPNKERK